MERAHRGHEGQTMSRKKPHRIPVPAPMATDARPTGDPLVAAVDAVNAAGHRSLRVGRTIGCWMCPREGFVGPDGKRVGAIFTERCAK